MKRTPWFSGSVKPVHVGLYERPNMFGGLCFQYWTGEYWGAWGKKRGVAVKNKDSQSIQQFGARWRGLAEKPK